MKVLTIGTESDTKTLMNVIRESEANEEQYFSINMLTVGGANSRINKRFIRQALFSDDCIALLIKEDDRCIGFMILLNDPASNLQSKPLLLMLVERQDAPILSPEMLNEVGISKIGCVLPARCKDIEEVGFVLEGHIEMHTASNYFYSVMTEGVSNYAN